MKQNCNNCRYLSVDFECLPCSACRNDSKWEAMTNADHIRSMTDEELAEYMSDHSIEDICYIVCGGVCKAMATFNKTSHQVCREIVADWLKQPYKGDADG